MNDRELQAMATRLLRQNGYSWSGRPKDAAKAAAKDDVLRRAIRCPFRGCSRKGSARR